ncbi:MAG: type IV pilus modification PilV family protein [bacterium]
MRRSNNSGFSMLEVMIAVVISTTIVGFVILGVLGAQRLNTYSHNTREASNVAEDKIEELRRLSFSQIQSGADSVEIFQRVWTVNEISNKPRIKQIELVVTWKDTKGRDHISTYNTTFYRNAYPYKS